MPSRRLARGIGLVLGLSGVVTLLTACSTSPSTVIETFPSDITVSPEHAKAIADGEITADEYDAGFRRYQSCLAEAGYDLIVGGEHNETINYSVPHAAVEAGVDEQCYEAEFSTIDQIWQIAREDTSHSAQVLKDCLVQNGVTPEDTMEELVEQIREAGIALESCGG